MKYEDWKAIYIEKTRTLRNWEIVQAIKTGGVVNLNIKGLGEGHIPTAKLTRYALNPEKDANKARAFEMALGYNLGNVDKLIENVERHINENEVVKKPNTGYGDRFQISMEITGENGKSALVTTAWILDDKTGELRLTTIYVDKKKRS